jgi:DNA processing protein
MLGVGRHGPIGRDDPPPVGGGGERAAPTERTGAVPAPDEAEREAWVVLGSVHGIGPVSFARLLAAFGSASAILAAARGRHAVATLVAASGGPDGASPALGAETAAAVVHAARRPGPGLAAVRALGLDVITLADATYPPRLRAIELPPPILFVRGLASAMAPARSVAIVGTRRPTSAGRALAGQIAEAVGGLGATVVSGLAVGIDAAAHAAALHAGAPTVAVIGGGHGHLYPAVHRGLADAIVARGGAVVSEFAPEVTPSRGTFPRRNRLISGLADATVVVEAGARSGALTTAAWALEQSRGLYLAPGRVGDPTVAGSLAFLREAAPEARIVSGVPELLEDLGMIGDLVAAPGRRQPAATGVPPEGVLASLGAAESAVARSVAAGVTGIDELVAATGLAGATILGALTVLEVRGLVVETFGRYRAAGALAGHGGRPARSRPAPPSAPRPSGRAA